MSTFKRDLVVEIFNTQDYVVETLISKLYKLHIVLENFELNPTFDSLYNFNPIFHDCLWDAVTSSARIRNWSHE